MAMQTRFGAAFSTILAVSAAACDDPEKAQQKCEGLVTTYCDRVVSCAEQGGLLDASFSAADLRDECEGFLNDDAHCEDAVRVSSSFNQCVDQSSLVSCGALIDTLTRANSQDERYLGSIPGACQDAVKYTD